MSLVGGLGLCNWYLNWSAETNAKLVCDEAAIGQDIETVIRDANAKGALDGKWADPPNHNFYFGGFMFDKAVCNVNVDRDGKVKSKNYEMEYD